MKYMQYNVDQAIRQAAEEESQPIHLADKIIAWIADLSSGNEQIGDASRARARVMSIYESVKFEVGSEE